MYFWWNICSIAPLQVGLFFVLAKVFECNGNWKLIQYQNIEKFSKIKSLSQKAMEKSSNILQLDIFNINHKRLNHLNWKFWKSYLKPKGFLKFWK